MSILDDIVVALHNQGSMPFVDFMHRALYAPHGGYYSTGTGQLGRGGDFITAPELTPLFGQTLANQCHQLFEHISTPSILEFGAGTGRLCVDLLTQLALLGTLPETYFILDVSGTLEVQQRSLIASQCPHLLSRVKWLSQWPTVPFNGIMIANEVLDAMPVHRFLQTKQGLLESHVVLGKESELEEQFKPCRDTRLIHYLTHALPQTNRPYQSEANLFIAGWIRECYTLLNQGVLLLLDYGFPRHEYYHPDRHHGTLMCHYQHRAHTNPLIHVGEQDITAHVDFTHVAEAAQEIGFKIAGYTNQASFLLGNGLLSLVSSEISEAERLRINQAIKLLVHPTEMGELFKVMALVKGLDISLNGFQWHDKRASL